MLTTRSQHTHWPELDGLRAIAVTGVVAFHSAPGRYPLPGGFLGVDLFFVLSAFLITTILQQEIHATGSVDLWRFYRRRFFRLMPALTLLLLGYLAAAPFVWPAYPHVRDAMIAGAYLSDYGYAFWHLPNYIRHTWSLSVEEHFYLLWPLLLAPLLRCRRPLLWLGIAYVTGTLWRASFVDWTNYYYRFDTRATGLILGAMLALMPRIRIAPVIATAAFGCLALLFTTGSITSAKLFITQAEFASAVLILAAVGDRQSQGPLGDMLRHRVAQYLGTRSYAIYLWHFPIAFFLRDKVGFVPAFAVTMTFSLAMAEISYRTVEDWGRRKKNAGARQGTIGIAPVTAEPLAGEAS